MGVGDLHAGRRPLVMRHPNTWVFDRLAVLRDGSVGRAGRAGSVMPVSGGGVLEGGGQRVIVLRLRTRVLSAADRPSSAAVRSALPSWSC
ncbi:hypothetical protein [Actinomadura keratinilytica]|uniref:Uncharacterized protein n=1 Tax=Actinomadura keratinilytica TaxID=547461 RepID=A0ABP7ZEW0_9ACTN